MGGSGSQHIVKLPVPISGPELTVMIFLLADWRCWQYELKRQNDTEVVNPPFIVLSLIKNIKKEAHLNLYSETLCLPVP